MNTYSCELPYEPSECGNLIHFEVQCSVEEVEKANKFIYERC